MKSLSFLSGTLVRYMSYLVQSNFGSFFIWYVVPKAASIVNSSKHRWHCEAMAEMQYDAYSFDIFVLYNTR